MAISGFFVDANLLVLLVVGRTQRGLIDKHRRLREYSQSDYDALTSLFDYGHKIYVTPNTLTEASNLLGYGPQNLRTMMLDVLKFMIYESDEITLASNEASNVPEFRWLGLTDAVLVELASKERPLVTSDAVLRNAVMSRDPDAAVDFNQLRRLT